MMEITMIGYYDGWRPCTRFVSKEVRMGILSISLDMESMFNKAHDFLATIGCGHLCSMVDLTHLPNINKFGFLIETGLVIERIPTEIIAAFDCFKEKEKGIRGDVNDWLWGLSSRVYALPKKVVERPMISEDVIVMDRDIVFPSFDLAKDNLLLAFEHEL